MAFDNEYYDFEKNGDGSYKVIEKRLKYSNGNRCIAYESMFADEGIILSISRFVCLAKYQGQYTLYAKQYIGDGYTPYYHGLTKFLDGILEYFYFDKVFLYQTVDGWFFFFCPEAFWYIENPTVLKKRVEGITKLCDADTQILDCKVLVIDKEELPGYSEKRTGYVVKTSNGNFLLYQNNFCVYDVATTHFIKMNRYSIVPGYSQLVKIYPNKGRNFFLASLDYYMSYDERYKDESYQKITYLGEGYLLAQKGQKSKLLFCDLGSNLPRTVADWDIQSFTKLDTQKSGDHVRTKWRVDTEKSSHIIAHTYDSWTTLPKLPEKKEQ